MSDATAELTVERDTIRSDPPDPEAPTERESLVSFAPGTNVHTIEQDAAEIERREAGAPPELRKSREDQRFELFANQLGKINESNHLVVSEIKRVGTKVDAQAEVTAHIANQVTAMRMLERGSRETNELEGIVVLVVDDVPEVLDTVRRLLHNMKATVYYADSEFEAKKRLLKIGNGKIDCAILDVVLGEELGTDLARYIRRDRPDCGIVFISGYGMQAYEEDANKLDAQLLPKPFSVEKIRDAVLDAATRGM